MNSIDKMFLERWKRFDFSTWNETAVREQFIAPLLDILGYAKGTLNDILYEKKLKLNQPYHQVGRDRVKIDYVPTIRLKTFWIIEAKPGNKRQMDFGDLLQAHLYAIHPEIQARLIVLINGWEIRVYDALTTSTWDDPIYVCKQDNCNDTFDGLKKILSAQEMVAYQRSRILEMIKATFEIEVDEKRLTSFQSEFHSVMTDSLKTVKKNEQQLSMSAWREAQEKELELLRKSDDKQLLIRMDIPTDGTLVTANEYVRRILEADTENRSRLIDQLARNYLGRPHAIFRVNCAYIFARLLQQKLELRPDALIKDIPAFLKQIVTFNLSYFSEDKLSCALCHLDNTSLRLAKKMSLRLAMDVLAKFVEEEKKSRAIEDVIKNRPSVVKYMIGLFGLMGESFWRMFCGFNSADEIWNGIWMLEIIEKIIEGMPVKKYPDGDSDLLFFEYYGRGFDMLCVGTWDVLNRCADILKKSGVAEEILKDVPSSRDDAIKLIPPSRPQPDGWKPDDKMISYITLLLKINSP